MARLKLETQLNSTKTTSTPHTIPQSERKILMAKHWLTPLLILAVSLTFTGCSPPSEKPLGIAVEFNNHAACAYVANAKGWFAEEGLELLPIFQTYESGTAVATALARGDIQIAYLGITAAINTYARGVPIKIASGIHKYGYGLVTTPKIKSISDLENKTIATLREGTVTDHLVNLMIEKHRLDNITILRMSPSDGVIALLTGRVDGAFIPEQHATTAELKGFPMLITSQEIWPGMQGDVLVLRTEFMQANPTSVTKLLSVTQRATDWINAHPAETAEIMAKQLQITGDTMFPDDGTGATIDLEVTPKILSRSMERMVYSTDLNPAIVQETIAFMVELGYIDAGLKAEDIMDLRYLQPS